MLDNDIKIIDTKDISLSNSKYLKETRSCIPSVTMKFFNEFDWHVYYYCVLVNKVFWNGYKHATHNMKVICLVILTDL